MVAQLGKVDVINYPDDIIEWRQQGRGNIDSSDGDDDIDGDGDSKVDDQIWM